MKKFVLLIALALFVFNANAQEKPTKDSGAVSFGAKAGVNFATITGDETSGVDARTSFHVGGVVEIPVSDVFSVQPELLYSSQGAKYKEEDIDVELKLDYLNLPIMAKFYVGEGFSLEAGPQIGIMLSSKFEVEGISAEIDEATKDIDFGLNFGLGYKMATGLTLGARYNLGLTNFWDSEGSESVDNKNGVIQISIGYFFN
jgi:hypothetical protein